MSQFKFTNSVNKLPHRAKSQHHDNPRRFTRLNNIKQMNQIKNKTIKVRNIYLSGCVWNRVSGAVAGRWWRARCPVLPCPRARSAVAAGVAVWRDAGTVRVARQHTHGTLPRASIQPHPVASRTLRQRRTLAPAPSVSPCLVRPAVFLWGSFGDAARRLDAPPGVVPQLKSRLSAVFDWYIRRGRLLGQLVTGGLRNFLQVIQEITFACLQTSDLVTEDW